MTRIITVGAAQLGPIERAHTRTEIVARLITLLEQGARHGCDLVVFPELALTTFFPRWYFESQQESDAGAGEVGSMAGDHARGERDRLFRAPVRAEVH